MEGGRERPRDVRGAERRIFRGDLKAKRRVNQSMDVDRVCSDWLSKRSGTLTGE